MRKLIIYVALAFCTTSVFANEKFKSFSCNKLAGNIDNVESVYLAGPTNEFKYRIRLFDLNGNQVDTGQCNNSEIVNPCYDKDMYGNPEESESKLSIRFLTQNHTRTSFQIEISRFGDKSRFVCMKQ